MRVFIVEDEPIIAMAMEAHLEGLGHEVCGRATHAQHAMASIPQARPELVLLDVNLGRGMTGLDVAHALRAQLDVPIVLLSAYARDDLDAIYGDTQGFSCVQKPFLREDLRVGMAVAVEEWRLREHAQQIGARIGTKFGQ